MASLTEKRELGVGVFQRKLYNTTFTEKRPITDNGRTLLPNLKGAMVECV